MSQIFILPNFWAEHKYLKPTPKNWRYTAWSHVALYPLCARNTKSFCQYIFYIQIKKVKLQLKWRTFIHITKLCSPKSLWNLTFVGEGSRIAPIGGASHRNLRKVRSRKPNTSENHDDALENWSYHYFPVGSSCFFFHASCQLWNFWLQRSRESLGARPLVLRGGKVVNKPLKNIDSDWWFLGNTYSNHSAKMQLTMESWWIMVIFLRNPNKKHGKTW